MRKVKGGHHVLLSFLQRKTIFNSPIRMYRKSTTLALAALVLAKCYSSLTSKFFWLPCTYVQKSYCTTISGGVGISKILKFLHLILLCDGQGADRQAILYKERQCGLRGFFYGKKLNP